ncbi:MAG TPA: lytic transglycosylase domain-containing protein, partial [Polyangiales bacterium]
QGRIGLVRCLLADNQHQGEAELEKLCRRYPRLGQRYALRLLLARARESWRDRLGAMALYRSIDLEAPETSAANEARAALDRLRDGGLHIPALTPLETVERADRLVLRGSIEAGRSAIADLLTMSSLPAPLKGRAHLMAARAARLEGRWEDVRDEVAKAINLGIPVAEAQRFLPRPTANNEQLDPAQGQAKIKKLLAGRSIRRLKQNQLRGVLDIALQYQLNDVATETLAAISGSPKMPPQARFDAAVLSEGIASDETVLEAFDGLRSQWGFQIASTYHHARALERLGRSEEARSEYRRVIDSESGATRYYSMWSEARLSGFEQLATGNCRRDPKGECLPDTGLLPPMAARPGDAETPLFNPPSPGLGAVFGERELEEVDARDQDRNVEDRVVAEANQELSAKDKKRESIVARLGALASVWGAAYPWIGRAADLAELERYDEAASEIGETYLAWRDARGDLRVRAGVEAVLTNAAPTRRTISGPMRRDRLALSAEARLALAEAADMLGEPGVAVRLRDTRSEQMPRAYDDDVERIAAKYAIDPNLLLAVMRVESVYYRQIVSFAGAIGLMQIMPLTGLRIARALGVRDYDTLDLLDPRKNLEFAAWYLSSLIKRFDGRLPLAIAAYNGGPHNVRLWLGNHPECMPLDAFLERIPFRETHNYVRSVLTHYAAYRAQKNLPMPNLAITLPKLQPDSIAF